jgi:hypothetical protein
MPERAPSNRGSTGGLSLNNRFPFLLALALLPCACSGHVAEDHVPADAASADARGKPDSSPDETTGHVDVFEPDVADAASADTTDGSCTADPENPFWDAFVVRCCGGQVCQGECVDGQCACGQIAGGCAPYLCCFTGGVADIMCLPEHLCLPQK